MAVAGGRLLGESGLKISIDVAASWLFLCSGPKRRPHLAPEAAGALENVRHATP